jgi:large subunit ribosomal protein L10
MIDTQEKNNKAGFLYRQAIIKQLSNTYKQRSNLIAANLNKVSAGDLSKLRQNLLSNDAKLFVTKISLGKNFLKSLNKDNLMANCLGSSGLIFVGKDIVNVSKVLSEFAKEHEEFKLVGGFLDDKLLSAAELDRIAKLPSKLELIAKTVMSIKSPLFRLRFVLDGNLRKLLLCLTSVKQTKEKDQPK